MNIGVYYQEDIKGEFMFSPLFEMLAALHVISAPDHHLDRLKWIETTAGTISTELIRDIQYVSSITNQWLIIMDFSEMNPYSDLNIKDAIAELQRLNLYRWNKIFRSYNKCINNSEKNLIINVMTEFYNKIFINEIKYLQPFLIRILKKELNECYKEGLLNRINKIHERIEVNGTEIILHKNKEYHFDATKLNKIVITASTFMSPHLLMSEEKGILGLTKLVVIEEKKGVVPSDLVLIFKALGDETRLKILHEMRKGPVSTQSLALALKITEAGISKHLKLLFTAGLVEKYRHGNYIHYIICKDAIDYIPYNLYEYIMR
ncbi:ArsR family transcriptional regulator [Mobilisporobacter senegalensis]|uniref:ArsR family transcriptional regulator n=1 Tax=Mobilisporobacter senegalensis TaxID=1329262 RepID=A0A3N1XPX2_9FIRM|nr:metalloregulator ArsR/SmtB family transcription factor [Mobilisporobacter senegalensis]ROR27152.1 ArsR family transcriptional regulator [Mobilisporobacter senegalensis]